MATDPADPTQEELKAGIAKHLENCKAKFLGKIIEWYPNHGNYTIF